MLLPLAVTLAVSGCGSSTTTVTTAATSVEPTAAQIREKAAAEATAHKEQVARKQEEAKEAAAQKKQEAKEAAQTKKEEAKEAAETSSGGSSSGGGGQSVPSDLINKSLPDAESELESKGIPFTTNSYGHIVIIHSDWGVCSTTPGPRHPVGGTVVLNLGHFSCGA